MDEPFRSHLIAEKEKLVSELTEAGFDRGFHAAFRGVLVLPREEGLGALQTARIQLQFPSGSDYELEPGTKVWDFYEKLHKLGLLLVMLESGHGYHETVILNLLWSRQMLSESMDFYAEKQDKAQEARAKGGREGSRHRTDLSERYEQRLKDAYMRLPVSLRGRSAADALYRATGISFSTCNKFMRKIRTGLIVPD